MRPAHILGIALAVAAVALTACQGTSTGGGRPRVVATTAILADFAKQVAGPDADVAAIIPPGVDLHSFEPAPSVAKSIAGANVIIVNGYHLEESLLPVIAQNKRKGATVIVAAAGLKARAAVEEHDAHEQPVAGLDPLATAEGDPHLWLSVAGARKYVENIRDGLIGADAAHADGYRQRATAYLATLDVLDAEVKTTIAKIPRERRQLVVFHDAYGYFAEAYGLTLTASVLPGGANQQVSAQKVAEVAAIVKRAGVPAVYREPEFDAKVLDAIAKETGARVLTLYSTYAGPVTDYPALMRADAAALVEGLAK
jgi:ABC-type Zn uptake system ZnuABC Zn-binding protein ZnuA